MVNPIQPFPMRKLDGTIVWIDPKTNKEITEVGMNERIQELWEQGTQVVMPTSGNYALVSAEGIEKFAELIVRDCLSIMEGYKFPDLASDKLKENKFCIGNNFALDAASEEISTHFGVGE